MYTCMHVHACAHMFMCVYVCSVPVCVFVCAYVCVCVHMCVHVCMPVCVHMCVYACVYTCMHMCMCVHVCICMSVHVCVYVRECLRVLPWEASAFSLCPWPLPEFLLVKGVKVIPRVCTPCPRLSLQWTHLVRMFAPDSSSLLPLSLHLSHFQSLGEMLGTQVEAREALTS